MPGLLRHDSPVLPDEIVKEILDPLLRVSDDEFRFKPVSAPFSKSLSSSFLILVCKQWCRVGTPSLYHTVVLRSPPQAQALSLVLSKDTNQPKLGSYIRKLRLEGCYGAYLSKIFTATCNITHLFLDVHFPASTSVKALVNGLRTVSPKHLILDDNDNGWKMNKGIREVFSCVVQCIESRSWSLDSVALPTNTCIAEFPPTSALVNALESASHLQTLYLDGNASKFAMQLENLQKIVGIPTLATILVSRHVSQRAKEQVRAMLGADCIEKLSFRDMAWQNRSQFSRRQPLQYSKRLQSRADFPDDIVSLILRFTLCTDTQGSSMFGRFGWSALPVLLVCKRFRDIGEPLVYECPRMPSVAKMSAFIDKVQNMTFEERSRIRHLRVNHGSDEMLGDPDFLGTTTAFQAKLQELLRLCPSVTVLSNPLDNNWGHHHVSLTDPTLAVLLRMHGDSLTELLGIDIPNHGDGAKLVDALQLMPYLKKLSMNSDPQFLMTAETAESSHIVLENLEEISVGRRPFHWDRKRKTVIRHADRIGLLGWLVFARIPKLRHLALKNWDEAAVLFLERHPQIEELTVPDFSVRTSWSTAFRTLYDEPCTIDLLPNLRVLRAHSIGSSSNNGMSGVELCLLTQMEESHQRLELICIDSGSGSPYGLKNDDLYGAFFSTVPFDMLPKLRRIIMEGCSWPTNQKQLTSKGKYSHHRRWLVFWKEMKARSVWLTDSEGVSWTGRLGF
ncbi:hypothetical protein DL96DRAFT_1597782 [Flagelloscypha sp. PMI_526]|nr:hypothetical protein DL96DRAFT_1597782 [Flagelloscypha sp. PMI_526]